MAFKVLFLAHAPDAEPTKHRSVIQTPTYVLHSVVVRDQVQAVQVCQQLVRDEGIQSVILCPGFSHADVAGIWASVGPDVAVSVARPDGPGSRVSAQVRQKEGLTFPPNHAPSP